MAAAAAVQPSNFRRQKYKVASGSLELLLKPTPEPAGLCTSLATAVWTAAVLEIAVALIAVALVPQAAVE
jgi:hypothetical protein